MNGWEAAHHGHRDCDGCNPFEDLAYGFPEYSGPLTQPRLREDQYAFVLVDGTEVSRSERGVWTGERYWLTAASLESGDADDRACVWMMQASGQAVRWNPATGTWDDEPVEPAAAVGEPAMSNPVVILYETNSDILVIAKGDNMWSVGAPAGDYLGGTFAQDARAWVEGEWEPCEADGQTPGDIDGLAPVAEWSAEDGVTHLVNADQLGGAAKVYLGCPK